MKIKKYEENISPNKTYYYFTLVFFKRDTFIQEFKLWFFFLENMYYLDFYDLEGALDHKEMFFKYIF